MDRSHTAVRAGLPALVATLGVCLSSFAGTIYVDADAPMGGDGTSWSTPYRYLQDALNTAAPDDEIRVGGGLDASGLQLKTYRPDQSELGYATTGDRTATFQLMNDVSVSGGYAGYGAPDPDQYSVSANETVLSGDLLGDDQPGFVNNTENSYHVVTGSYTNRSASLRGFTITGGNGNAVIPHDAGGGLYIYDGAPSVDFCTFQGNYAQYGGATLSYVQSAPFFLMCTFTQNAAQVAGAALDNGSSPVYLACAFDNNTALVDGGAIAEWHDSTSTFTDCDFLTTPLRTVARVPSGAAVQRSVDARSMATQLRGMPAPCSSTTSLCSRSPSATSSTTTQVTTAGPSWHALLRMSRSTAAHSQATQRQTVAVPSTPTPMQNSP